MPRAQILIWNTVEDIDRLKTGISGPPNYRLGTGNLYVSPDGFHYLDALDPVDQISPEVDQSELTSEIETYIESELQANPGRFQRQVSLVRQHLASGSKILDIGCGGGLFLSQLRDHGFVVEGSDLSDSRVHYARTRHHLEVTKRTIEDPYWAQRVSEFDGVTLWDVIEHVNFPRATVETARKLLRSGGLIFIDTPCRDSFYHRFGEFSYKVSRGRFPTFLNMMYSESIFGHKQIFSTIEMRQLLGSTGYEILYIQKFHELSFPYSFYLRQMLRSKFLVNLTLPVVRALLAVFPIRNKMIVVARRTPDRP